MQPWSLSIGGGGAPGDPGPAPQPPGSLDTGRPSSVGSPEPDARNEAATPQASAHLPAQVLVVHVPHKQRLRGEGVGLDVYIRSCHLEQTTGSDFYILPE